MHCPRSPIMSRLSDAVSVRPAVRADMETVAIMGAEFHGFLAAIDGSDPVFDLSACRAKLERCGFGDNPLFQCLVAEVEGEAVGYAIYSIGFWADGFEGMVFVTDLFVREAWRGQVIGRKLMQSLAQAGKAAGCERVMWTVWRKNLAARRFYEQLGGVAIDDELLFSWPIP